MYPSNIKANSNLQGSIPHELNYLSWLSELDLSYNKLTGTIPNMGLMSSLTSFVANNNILGGTLPESIFNLPRLKKLALFSNQELTGPIPPTRIPSGSALEMLDIYDCHLTGPLPDTFSAMDKLKTVVLFNNAMTGQVPTSLLALSNVEVISLEANQLMGTIPLSIQQATNLKFLRLARNHLTGNLPSVLGNLTLLVSLRLESNAFTGHIPTFSEESKLQELHVENNFLTGSVETFLTNAPRDFWYLYVGNNSFTGSIPTWIGKFTELMSFDASRNYFTGSIPTEVGTMHSLERLELSYNLMTGTLPAELAMASGLKRLDVANNQFHGTIPQVYQGLHDLGKGLKSGKLSRCFLCACLLKLTPVYSFSRAAQKQLHRKFDCHLLPTRYILS